MDKAVDWIGVDSTELRKAVGAELRQLREGVTLTVSPYDVPEALRGSFDADKHRYVIEFKYVDDEPYDVADVPGPARLSVGKRSGRIDEIEIESAGEEAGRSVAGLCMIRLRTLWN